MIRLPLRLAPLLCLLLLAACSADVGEGRGPESLHIVTEDGEGESFETFECAAVTLYALARFAGNDAQLENVSNRALWTSSDPGVAQVSNGELPLPDGSGYYGPGAVIALRPGSALITAEYGSLRAQFALSASPIGELRIEPALARLAPETEQTFELTTTVGTSSVPVDVTAAAAWRIVTAGAPASVKDTSTLVALSGPVDEPFVLEARIPLCGRMAQRSLQLGTLQALQLTPEQPAGADLPLGHSEFIRVQGVFSDPAAPPQDLGRQVAVEHLMGESFDAGLDPQDDGIAITPLAERLPLQYRFRLESAGLAADTAVIEARELEMLALRVSPERLDLEIGEEARIEAFGHFEDGIERPVRRRLQWSVRDAAVATVGNGHDGGTVLARRLEADSVIEARDPGLSGLDAEIPLRVFAEKPR